MTQQQETVKPQAPVFTDRYPEYPFLMYNHETRQTKAATDKKNKEELAKEGWVEEPLPPEEPDELTPAETSELEALLAKAAKALAKLGRVSRTHEPADSKTAAKK